MHQKRSIFIYKKIFCIFKKKDTEALKKNVAM